MSLLSSFSSGNGLFIKACFLQNVQLQSDILEICRCCEKTLRLSVHLLDIFHLSQDPFNPVATMFSKVMKEAAKLQKCSPRYSGPETYIYINIYIYILYTVYSINFHDWSLPPPTHRPLFQGIPLFSDLVPLNLKRITALDNDLRCREMSSFRFAFPLILSCSSVYLSMTRSLAATKASSVS